jgi:hypothetical protein
MTKQFSKSISNWTTAQPPSSDSFKGESCRVELLTQDHAKQLWEANSYDVTGKNFNYLSYGPFKEFQGKELFFEILFLLFKLILLFYYSCFDKIEYFFLKSIVLINTF